MVPHLTTALNGPILELERRFLDATPEIERWLRGQWQEHTPPFYGSVDLRNSGFKLAPVAMNSFSDIILDCRNFGKAHYSALSASMGDIWEALSAG